VYIEKGGAQSLSPSQSIFDYDTDSDCDSEAKAECLRIIPKIGYHTISG